MPKKRYTQSLNISGSQLSNVQTAGTAGRDLTIQQTQGQSTSDLTQADVIELITQLEALFRHSGLPTDQQEKAIQHLAVAKEEAQTQQPDKDFLAKSLQRSTHILKEGSATITAGKGLWHNVRPILAKLEPWLGVAAISLL